MITMPPCCRRTGRWTTQRWRLTSAGRWAWWPPSARATWCWPGSRTPASCPASSAGLGSTGSSSCRRGGAGTRWRLRGEVGHTAALHCSTADIMITSAGILKFMDFDKFYRNESEYLDVLCLLDLMMIVIVDRESQKKPRDCENKRSS